ncbi:Sulfotransferase family protein [Sphingomonas antarctica]|uniref:hypothetical protein n=1 Tax=Sphingomonas antarctica TaxID=2040274 RepID=UPI0039EC25F1
MSPDAYLHRIEDGAAVFLPMDRAAYHRSIFLDHRVQAARSGEASTPVGDAPVQPIAFIFHVAHCGSTLLARALDRIESNLVLREPMALRQAALDPNVPLDAVLGLLSRRYRPDLPTLIKANVPVNFVLSRIVAAVPGMRALFLHMPLESWLAAVLRSPQHRHWVHQVSTLVGLPVEVDDAAAAAQLWLAQTDAFRAAMMLLPDSVSLDADRFFSHPAEAIAASAPALHVAMSGGEAAQIAAGPLFTHDAKRPANVFDNAERVRRALATKAAIAIEISAARKWIEARGGDTSPLPRALI